ncbi:MAG: peptidylprolyl isomerase [Alphaproteobacteria bacterium]|nr:peptidylprolyl isomerase [Alphaproteobacteria bacterium]
MKKMIISMVMALAVVVSLGFAAPAQATGAGTDGIAAVVNDEPILMSAVADRMKLLMISSGMPNNDETRAKIRPQVVNILIDEALRLQEAKEQDVVVDEAAIDEGFASIAAQNNMDAEKFKAVLKNSNINIKTLREQIRSQVAWSRVVQEKLSNQVEVSEFDVETAMETLRANVGKSEYLAAEIFLPVDSPSEEGNVKQLAERLAQQLKGGDVRFSAIAGQFSQAAGASKGGDLGWVQQGQLAPELEAALVGLQEGEITPPLRSLTGYHILLLRGKRASAPDTMPAREDVFNRIGMQNLDRVQRRHFLSIKAAAFIDRRGV